MGITDRVAGGARGSAVVGIIERLAASILIALAHFSPRYPNPIAISRDRRRDLVISVLPAAGHAEHPAYAR